MTVDDFSLASASVMSAQHIKSKSISIASCLPEAIGLSFAATRRVVRYFFGSDGLSKKAVCEQHNDAHDASWQLTWYVEGEGVQQDMYLPIDLKIRKKRQIRHLRRISSISFNLVIMRG